MKPSTKKTVTFRVQIPNLDGDAIAETVPIEVQVYADPETGEEVLTQESLDLIEKTQARHMGLMSPEEIRELRLRLDLTQQEISELLQVGEKTYTRWENGRSRPSRSMNVLLCAFRDGWLNLNYLRSLRNPEMKADSAFFRQFTEPNLKH
jgi:DNA-binding transcriptional regulator YiaG